MRGHNKCRDGEEREEIIMIKDDKEHERGKRVFKRLTRNLADSRTSRSLVS